ncbi:MAG: alpha/beta fold hydrolase [Bacteroidetes bacterium]|nr:alpha/beta fold hydrolase [Bacteroidota bacterium]MBV6460147.1 Proline iminopeptidase [Flavobacteriales bacterium]WKZ74019.1 MAG: alpha/beta fold hydrolase [Vicingaceae bacterium]MCL4817407.1 alpha/beta fold hydrolase [Flavobacteriales bacterium]NOG96054.1 alpha/beta fold hydrolase [Bacteroidota bacterium]
MKHLYFPLIIALLLFACSEPTVEETENNKEKIEIKTEEVIVEANNIQFFVKKVGSGTPILVIHGGPGYSHNYFLPHLETLAQEFQFIFYDQRGCGKSSFPTDSAFKMDDYVADLSALVSALKLDTVNILAHSWGGLIALNYASTHSDKINKLVLSNSYAVNSTFHEQSLEKKNTKRSEQDTKEWVEVIMSNEYKSGNADAVKKAFVLNEKYNLAKPENYESVFSQMDFSVAAQKQMKLVEGLSERYLFNYTTESLLPSILTKTLIIAGDLDNIPFDATQILHDNLKKSEFVVIKNSCHYPFAENPDDFNSAFKKFFEN